MSRQSSLIGFFVCVGLGVADLLLINISVGPAAFKSATSELAAASSAGAPAVVVSVPPKAQPPKAAPSPAPKALPKDEPPPKDPQKDEPAPAPVPPPAAPPAPAPPKPAPPPEVVALPSMPIIVRFRTADYRVSSRGRRALGTAIKLLKKWPTLHVEVTGHADQRGEAAKNMRFSELRAGAVVKLLEAARISSARIHQKGLGDSKPVDPRNVPEAWRRNRRAEIRLTKDKP